MNRTKLAGAILLGILLAGGLTTTHGKRESRTEIGEIKTYGGAVSLIVTTRANGSKDAMLYTRDEYVIESVALRMSKHNLRRLIALCEETLEELDSR